MDDTTGRCSYSLDGKKKNKKSHLKKTNRKRFSVLTPRFLKTTENKTDGPPDEAVAL